MKLLTYETNGEINRALEEIFNYVSEVGLPSVDSPYLIGMQRDTRPTVAER